MLANPLTTTYQVPEYGLSNDTLSFEPFRNGALKVMLSCDPYSLLPTIDPYLTYRSASPAPDIAAARTPVPAGTDAVNTSLTPWFTMPETSCPLLS